ncbi:CHAD domain-containing protein [Methyloligella solikamskensis]|uniref:CHAD domain-containing protein n=1 Tax=Methyloligella solikamskensis TaxID=1177756 RepID=A0ABW3JCE0_9HYPH
MAYTFKLGKSVEKNTRRVAKSQIEKAIAEIDDGDLNFNDTVHQVRKRCKKLRGLIRMVRPCFDDYKRENIVFRDASRELSYVRDTEATLETHDDLMEFYGSEVDGFAYAAIRGKLLERKEQAIDELPLEEKLARFRETMCDAKARANDWKIDGRGFEAIAGGIEKTYKRGRKAMAETMDDPTPEALHQWRKRVKYHWYHTRLLGDIWPEMMVPYGAAAKRLSDLLGAHHDLAVLQDIAPDLFDGNRDAMKTYLGLAQGRQALLESQTFHLGQRLFAEKPSALTKRWGAYWEAWQAGDESRHLLQAA